MDYVPMPNWRRQQPFFRKERLYINLQLTKKVLIATMKFDIKGRKLVSEYGKW